MLIHCHGLMSYCFDYRVKKSFRILIFVMGIINYQFIHLIVTKLLLAVTMELSSLML